MHKTSDHFMHLTKKIKYLENIIQRIHDNYEIFCRGNDYLDNADSDFQLPLIYTLDRIELFLTMISGYTFKHTQTSQSVINDLMPFTFTINSIIFEPVVQIYECWNFETLIDHLIMKVGFFLHRCKHKVSSIIYIQRLFRQRYYQVGGLGYVKAKLDFDTYLCNQ